jgi:hypothetical protein
VMRLVNNLIHRGTGPILQEQNGLPPVVGLEAIPEFRMFVSSSSPRRFAGCTDDGA